MVRSRKDTMPEQVSQAMNEGIDINKDSITVKENPIPKEYTLEITKDYDGTVDLWHLNNKDPNYEYRWLRHEEKNLSIKTGNMLHDRGGWQLVPKEHLLRCKIIRSEKELHPDGTLRRGDTVLSFMPKDLYKLKEDKRKEKADDRIKSIKRMVEKGEGGKGLHPTMKGIQTAGALNMGSTGEIHDSRSEEG